MGNHKGCPYAPHSYDLTPHPYDLTPHPYDLTPHPYDLTPHPYDLTPHPYDLTPHSYDLTPHSSPLTPHPSLSRIFKRHKLLDHAGKDRNQSHSDKLQSVAAMPPDLPHPHRRSIAFVGNHANAVHRLPGLAQGLGAGIGVGCG